LALVPVIEDCAAETPSGVSAAFGHTGHPRGLLRTACRLFDLLEARWEAPGTRRALANGLVVLFLGMLGVIELGRQGWLPSAAGRAIPAGHFAAIGVVFAALLVFEVASLVFALARSVAVSLGKQFELLALILVRETFAAVGHAGEPIDWAGIAATVPHMTADMAGALIVFGLLVPYARVQRHRAITARAEDQAQFICEKKVVSVLLLGAFLALGANTVTNWFAGVAPTAFFATFYTVLVFSDVLLVLISMRYSATFPIVFRNAAFAAATMLMRLALSAPPYVKLALAVGGVLFAIGASVGYNAWTAATAREERNLAAAP
jgi:hypothetical protein